MKQPSNTVNRNFQYPASMENLLQRRISEILHATMHYSTIPASVFKNLSRGAKYHVSTLATDPQNTHDPFLDAARQALEQLSQQYGFAYEEFGDDIPIDPEQPMS